MYQIIVVSYFLLFSYLFSFAIENEINYLKICPKCLSNCMGCLNELNLNLFIYVKNMHSDHFSGRIKVNK